MEHLSELEHEELKAKLTNEKTTLEKELSEHGRKVGEDWVGTTSGFEANEADVSDAADRMEELVNNVPLVEELEKRYHEVTDALKRISEGTYGLTESGEEIPVERLRANPAAFTNI